MSYFKAKVHQIWFLASVRRFDRLCLRWSLALTDAFAQTEVVIGLDLVVKWLGGLRKPRVGQKMARNHFAHVLHLVRRHWRQHADMDTAIDVVVILLKQHSRQRQN